MFGDIAHGSILFSFGVFMCFRKKDESGENMVLKLFMPHRYLITMMGFFAVYCGFIYNDFMSISLDLFGSCYNLIDIVPKEDIPRLPDCVYPFGIDPIWAVA